MEPLRYITLGYSDKTLEGCWLTPEAGVSWLRGKFLQEEIRRGSSEWSFLISDDHPVNEHLVVYPLSLEGLILATSKWQVTYGLFLQSNQKDQSSTRIFPVVSATLGKDTKTQPSPFPFPGWVDLSSLIPEYPSGQIYLCPDVWYGSRENILEEINLFSKGKQSLPQVFLRKPEKEITPP